MDTFLQDLRYAVRRLAKNPAFTAIAILTLTLGIGANVGVFSVINAVLLRPLPYQDSNRLATWLEQNGGNFRLPSYPTMKDWQDQSTTVDFAYARGLSLLTPTEEGPARIITAYVTPGFFSLLGVAPRLGRTPLADDDRTAGARVAVISHALWQRRFGSDRSAVGKSIILNDERFDVIGVMTEQFALPTWADAWVPLAALPATDRTLVERGLHVDGLLIGKRKQGITEERAKADMDVIAARLASAYPADNAQWVATSAFPLDLGAANRSKPALLIAWVAVGLVLLVACTNLAGLLLARSESHGREIAIRAALGADRARVLRQVLAENALLAVAGGTMGTVVAFLAAGFLRDAAQLNGIPRANEITVDGSVLVFALVVSAVVTAALGLVPARHATTLDLVASLRAGTAGSGTALRRTRARSTLVAAQVAMAMSLLVGAALLSRSFWTVNRVDPGFQADHLLTLDVFPPLPKYQSEEAALGLFGRLHEALSTVPGVRSVALTNALPFYSPGIPTPVLIDGKSSGTGTQETAAFRVISAGYFDTMGVNMVSGREFGQSDNSPASTAIIVNKSFADRYWPRQTAIGHQVTVYKRSQARAGLGQPIQGEVVGVAADMKAFGLDQPTQPEVFLPYAKNLWGHMFVVARVEGDTQRAIAPMRQAIMKVDPGIPLAGASRTRGFGFQSMDQQISQSLAPRRFSMTLMGLLAVIAVLVSAVGIYGITSYVVAQRNREFALRMALGARRGQVLGKAIASGMRPVVVGLFLGSVAAFNLTRFMSAMLYGVDPRDEAAFVGAVLLFLAVGLAACLAPALRATRVDANLALRSE